jgi:hypothetical protein
MALARSDPKSSQQDRSEKRSLWRSSRSWAVQTRGYTPEQSAFTADPDGSAALLVSGVDPAGVRDSGAPARESPGIHRLNPTIN